MRNHIRVALCLFASSLGLAGAGCSSSPGQDGEDVSTSTSREAVTTAEIMARAQQWVDDRVPYCGGVNHGHDWICGGTCSRPAAPWDHYRTDCSGFVSWCWQITDDPTTDSYIYDRSGSNGWHTIA